MSMTIDELKASIRSRCIVDTHTNCLLWTGAKNSQGYGVISYMGRVYRVHRLAMYLWKEGFDINSKLVVQHLCNTPACVNYKHLSVSTQKKNMEYSSSLGRIRKGEDNIFARLTESDVRNLKKMVGEAVFSKAEIARRFKISRRHLYYIINNERWSHLDSKKGANKS